MNSESVWKKKLRINRQVFASSTYTVTSDLVISRLFLDKNGNEMYQNVKCTMQGGRSPCLLSLSLLFHSVLAAVKPRTTTVATRTLQNNRFNRERGVRLKVGVEGGGEA